MAKEIENVTYGADSSGPRDLLSPSEDAVLLHDAWTGELSGVRPLISNKG